MCQGFIACVIVSSLATHSLAGTGSACSSFVQCCSFKMVLMSWVMSGSNVKASCHKQSVNVFPKLFYFARESHLLCCHP